MRIGGLALAACSTVACYDTEPFHAAHAERDRAAFGFAQHSFSFLANASVWSAAQAAALAADGTRDSVWRLYEGGRTLQYCEQATAAASCVGATWVDEDEPDLPMGIAMIMVNPLNRGRYAYEETVPNADGSNSAYGWGLVYISDWDMPLVPGRGVWLTTTEQPCALFGAGAPLFHCQLEQGRPTCRTVELSGERAEICGVAGVHVLGTQDVVWIYDMDDVYRCVAHEGQPAPSCRRAKQQGPGPAPPVAAVPVPPKPESAAPTEPAPKPVEPATTPSAEPPAEPAPAPTEGPPTNPAPTEPAPVPTTPAAPAPAPPPPTPAPAPGAKGKVGASCKQSEDCEAGLRCIASSCTPARSTLD